ncbi:hypothetical protein EK21DRAFT_91728 [Setomelanomma holmii]|uniref:Uncharacterized protein n=1 Tax=Setomelanomma holmii TaxID=210430 RepID=A0A9P4H2L7_9PLEO|nr:hypothetical protein EK21DRAFT_91728 [Setomelanomma holmii]
MAHQHGHHQSHRHFRDLHTLPATLNIYTLLPAPNPPPDERCFLCLNPFFHSDPDPESDAPPCHPLIICSNKHLIGSSCAPSLFASETGRTCSLCREPVRPSGNALPMWLVQVVDTVWFRYTNSMVWEGLVNSGAWSSGYVEYLEAQTFRRELTLCEAWDVLFAHARARVGGHAKSACVVLAVQVVFWLGTLPWGQSYPELWLIAPSFVNVRSKRWCLIWLVLALAVLSISSRQHLNDIREDEHAWNILRGRYRLLISCRQRVPVLDHASVTHRHRQRGTKFLHVAKPWYAASKTPVPA